MKIKVLCLLFSILLLVSCASTNNSEKSDKNIDIQQTTENLTKNYDEINQTSEDNDLISESTQIIPEKTEEELYLEFLDDVCINLISSPNETKKNTAFSEPYVVKVTDSQGNPIPDFNLSAEYPIEKDIENGNLIFKTENLTTNADGKIELKIENCNFSTKTNILFYPSQKYENDEILKKIESLTVKAEYLVKSDVDTKGAVLFIWSFNELDKPMKNLFQMITSLRNKGVYEVCNAPVNDKSDIGKSKEYLYNANYQIIEDSFGYLVCGTVKFISPVQKVDDKYEANLIADIYALDMKNGNEILSFQKTNSSLGSNWNDAVNSCTEELCDSIAEELVYGL